MLLLVLAGLLAAAGQNAPGPAPIAWLTDPAAALSRSRETGRPVLLLLQEIRGGEAGAESGAGPLSHPLLAAAAETAFVPVSLRGGRPGGAAEAPDRLGGPARVLPVLRFLDASGQDVAPPLEGESSVRRLAGRMAAALRSAGRRVPTWLELAEQEGVSRPATALFAMHCYWEGEARLGSVPGVCGTRVGWVGDEEVVEVSFDPARTLFADLLEAASRMDCASTVYPRDAAQRETVQRADAGRLGEGAASFRPAKAADRKYYLRRSLYRYLPLTLPQQLKVNSALGLGQSPDAWLTPAQLDLLEAVRKTAAPLRERTRDWFPPGAWVELPAYEARVRRALAIGW